MKRLRTAVSASILALSLTFAVPVLASTEVNIFHSNDVHGRLIQTGSVIGIDTIAAILESAENAILVDAGDAIHGVPFVNLGRGQNAVELMSRAGYSLLTPGNHEFNFGWERLVELGEMADFDIIAANVYLDGELLFEPTAIIEVAGVRLGFIGLATPSTVYLTNPANVAELTFGDPVAAAQYFTDVLEAEGVDVIIALAHLGSGMRREGRVDGLAIDVAEGVNGLHLIIDGHSHTIHEYGYEVNGTLIVQVGDHNNNLGHVVIVVDEDDVQISASLITREYAGENFEPLAAVTELIEQLQADMDEVLNIVVGYLPYELEVEYIRAAEMPIGNLVADAMLYFSGADIAVANGGGIRDILPAGDVTQGDIVSVLPFGNNLVVLEVTPAILWEVLENSVSAMPGAGRFLQVSESLSFTFDELGEAGERVQSVRVNGQEIDRADNETVLTMGTNNFMAAGGDDFTMLADLDAIAYLGTLEEIVIAYMAIADTSNLAVEGRIINLADAQAPAFENLQAEEPAEETYAPEEYTAEAYEAEEYVAYVAAPAEAPAAPAPVAAGGLYTVVSGDSLYTIARSQLGSGNRWYEIYYLNNELIAYPRVIQIGWQLRLPS
ncbi:MAG: 5'-nucleotidase C-terminal domain-containing protein [Defluviitaleaceae bacterium]|nr:5'-nucleotidase C-terminal domain-containing protein [Defluviitaleaceae bacterium]